jgi:hypothetical protein
LIGFGNAKYYANNMIALEKGRIANTKIHT